MKIDPPPLTLTPFDQKKMEVFGIAEFPDLFNVNEDQTHQQGHKWPLFQSNVIHQWTLRIGDIKDHCTEKGTLAVLLRLLLVLD